MVTAAQDIAEWLRSSPKWEPLRPHPEHTRLWNSKARFKVVPAGRRSGKTELAKRKGVKLACTHHERSRFDDGMYMFAAPTRDQAKTIYWEDLKERTPPMILARDPLETELEIRLLNGSRLKVVGMDRPHRVEGSPIDWFCGDEIADWRPEAWGRSVLPALSTTGRPGEAWLIGKPKGRNFYHELYLEAIKPESADWDGFHWKSSEVLLPEEIAVLKASMDPLSYEQECEASFLNFAGRAYYPFTVGDHVRGSGDLPPYNPKAPLIFCFDFNVEPGVAVVVQEMNDDELGEVTVILGEVWIRTNSNTPAVCRRLVQDWGDHQGEVFLYGDSTGGARGSAKVDGSDWELIRKVLYPAFPERVSSFVERSNPQERSRVNAMNSRLLTTDGSVRMYVSASCTHLIKDLEGVVLLEGGSGEIDKKHDQRLTHLTDALGYYVEAVHPVGEHIFVQESF